MMWANSLGIASLGPGIVKIEATFLTPFHATLPISLGFAPQHHLLYAIFVVDRVDIETGVTNVKSAVGPQTAVISCNAGSELTHPASQHSLMLLNLCSTETHFESPHVTSASCVSIFVRANSPITLLLLLF